MTLYQLIDAHPFLTILVVWAVTSMVVQIVKALKGITTNEHDAKIEEHFWRK